MPGPAGCPRVLPSSALLPVPPRSVSQPLSRSALSPQHDGHLSPRAPPGWGRPLLSLQPRTLEAQRQAGLPAHLLHPPFRCPPSTWRLADRQSPPAQAPTCPSWQPVGERPAGTLFSPARTTRSLKHCELCTDPFPSWVCKLGRKEILSYLGFLLHTIPHAGR